MSVIAEPPVPTIRARRGASHRFGRDPVGVIAAVVVAALVVLALIAPLLGLPDPTLVSLRDADQPPGPEHLLGTDAVGRDILSRLVWGSRTNLLGAALAVAVAVAVGLPSGLVAGYFGGWFDRVADWVNSLNMALPGIVVVLAVRSVTGPSVWIAMAVFGIVLAPAIFRLVRAAVQSVRGELYVDAARVSGLGDARIISRHVLTVVRAPIIIQVARLTGIAIGIQAGLEFLGVSDNTVPSWGNMLNEGFRRMALNPQLVLWPSLFIALTCMALILLGNSLRDALEDSGRRRTPHDRRRSPTTVPADTPADPAALLSVRQLHVGYGSGAEQVEVVRGIDLDVAPGEVLGLIGESGSGKTQTAFSVLGLLPDGGRVVRGSVVFDGREMTASSATERQRLRGVEIAYIPQEPMSNLDPTARIGHQLTTPLRVRLGLSAREAKTRALTLLEKVGIPDPEKAFGAYPHEISGGMAQRVLIAGAVSCNPRLLIADEPTTALDVTVQAEVLDLLRDLQAETGMSMIIVTHDFGVVADICDRVAVMQNGRIVETADTSAVFASPENEYTRRLVGSMLEGRPARRNPFGDPADPFADGGERR
ncbi:dipeptide/oligopeptide/nickel ABC transporter permease/ATP-binding protein [Microbacterium sp. 18062]|uniref:dipeptide/oligopeptide/nickel ABC transporter permease/ATP-binding protein n=1 Tax=Microbacterium sp. 18062 TaxID=2681410 RepID=UPI001356DEB3|nr:dipeptide/oligopeptide/nickel ABC transporter permease/ATP-binding protein [Microbacterium sp. 18062]